MNHRIQFLIVTILFLAAKSVVACECPEADYTVLGKFENARFVAIGRVTAVETSQAKVVIEKVYKGNLKVGQELIFGQGQSGTCFEDFATDEIGVKFLFYLQPKEKTPAVWYGDRCERTRPLPGFHTNHVSDAADDLAYLDKMDQVAGKTRISGTLISYQWSPTHGGADFKKVAATKVRLFGEKGSYETQTNQDGVYEIYDLPPGRYTVEPKIPKGWAIDEGSAWGGGSSSGTEDSENSQVVAKKGRHAYFDFTLKVDAKVRGRVLDPSGKPMKSVCVKLLPTEGKVSEYFKKIDCTDAAGGFEIDEVPFGPYFIVINIDDKLSAREPFRRFYYPNVYEREKAKVVTVVEGYDAEPIDIHVPEVKEVVDIEGVFLSADRMPVTRASIFFQVEQSDELIDGGGFTRTDEKGRFVLRVLKGLKGKLVGTVDLDDNEFKKCPQLVASLKTNPATDWRTHKTDPIDLHIEGNVNNLVLKLPFASCSGGKIVSRMRVD